MRRRNTPGQPDPDRHPWAYEEVLPRRLAAWALDMTLSAILAAALLPFTLFLGLLVFPAMIMVVGFVYRWTAIAAVSATPGMALLGLQFRDRDGFRLTGNDAFWHSAGYTLSILAMPLQAISIALMLLDRRHRGLTDLVLGTVLVNRRPG